MNFYEEKIFPAIIEKQMGKDNYKQERNTTLSNVTGKTLEIGFGTGLNLPHYPEHVKKITALDINPGMNSKAQERMQHAGIEVEYHCLNSEALPFETGSFDTVVSTWTLCSIADLDSALAEIHRVLKPTGEFLFLEHGLAEGATMKKLQNLFTPLQKKLACGCHLNRAIDQSIQESGFNIKNLERFWFKGATSPLASPMYRGVAKPIPMRAVYDDQNNKGLPYR